ncbi:hypothetical protein RJD24_02775 [Bacillaceae bacterium IKA-2]|nr:hypothetical protein RJD24_02775 [Bacillaceae bacterium IKA-2]
MSENILKQVLEEVKNLNNGLANIENQLNQMDSRFDTLDTTNLSMQSDITDIKQGVQRIEESHPEDVIGMLKTINSKLDERDNEMLAINRRLYRVEGVVEGVSKQ